MTDYMNETRRLMRLFYPILMAQIAQTAMTTIDTLMAGQVSARDLAAISVATSFWLPMGLLVYGILIALTPVIAQLHGAKKDQKIAFELYQGIWIAVPTSIVTMLVLYHCPVILQFIDIDDILMEKTTGYLHAVLWGVPGIAGYILLRNLIEGMSETKPTMIISLIGLLCNIPANYVFIYGAGPIPAYGGVGCGIATAIVFWIMLISSLIYVAVAQRYRYLDLTKTFYRPDWQAIQRILKLGLPIAFSIFCEVSLFTVVSVLIAPLGPIIVAGHQVAFNVSNLIFTLPLSLGLAVTIRVGHSLGEQKPIQAKIATHTALFWSVVMASITACLTLLLRENIADWYSNNQDVIAVAAHLLLFSAAYQVSDGVQVVIAHALRGYKDTQIIFVITLVSYWCIGFVVGATLGLTDWIVPAMGAQGFWIGFICGLSSAAILLGFRLRTIFSRFDQSAHPHAQPSI